METSREKIYLTFAILKSLAVSFGSSTKWKLQEKCVIRF